MKVSKKNYKKSINVKANVKDVFNALTKDLSKWWGSMDSPVNNVEDIFIVSWGKPWYKFKVIEYLPFERIVWECIDANQIIEGLIGVEKEWVGTVLEWSIQQKNNEEVEINFVHKGLIPNFICYDFCSSTWDHFINNELRKYLEKE